MAAELTYKIQQWCDHDTHRIELYQCGQIKKRKHSAHTGSKPNIFVIETVLEHVAKFLSMDPIIVKQKNLYAQGDRTPMGFILPYCSIRDLYACEFSTLSWLVLILFWADIFHAMSECLRLTKIMVHNLISVHWIFKLFKYVNAIYRYIFGIPSGHSKTPHWCFGSCI